MTFEIISVRLETETNALNIESISTQNNFDVENIFKIGMEGSGQCSTLDFTYLLLPGFREEVDEELFSSVGYPESSPPLLDMLPLVT